MVTQRSRQESLADEKQREKKKKEKEFKKRHKQWLEKERGKGISPGWGPFKGPDLNKWKNLTPEEKWERRKEAEKYQAMNKGGAVNSRAIAKKYFKGGMV